MPYFQDVPREVRDEIYGYCLLASYNLVTQSDGCATCTIEMPHTKLAVELLSTSKAMHAETAYLFYQKNTFRIPCDSELQGKPSAFSRYPTAFRSLVCLLVCNWISEDALNRAFSSERGPRGILDQWSATLETLKPMTKLQFLEIDFNWESYSLSERHPFETFLPWIKDELVRNVPLSVRNRATSRTQGTWLTGISANRWERDQICMAVKEIGAKVDTRPYRCMLSTRISSTQQGCLG